METVKFKNIKIPKGHLNWVITESFHGKITHKNKVVKGKGYYGEG